VNAGGPTEFAAQRALDMVILDIEKTAMETGKTLPPPWNLSNRKHTLLPLDIVRRSLKMETMMMKKNRVSRL
jgi:hypothetical protein